MNRPCLRFRPDHNGECLECDDWYAEHLHPQLDRVLQGEVHWVLMLARLMPAPDLYDRLVRELLDILRLGIKEPRT